MEDGIFIVVGVEPKRRRIVENAESSQRALMMRAASSRARRDRRLLRRRHWHDATRLRRWRDLWWRRWSSHWRRGVHLKGHCRRDVARRRRLRQRLSVSTKRHAARGRHGDLSCARSDARRRWRWYGQRRTQRAKSSRGADRCSARRSERSSGYATRSDSLCCRTCRLSDCWRQASRTWCGTSDSDFRALCACADHERRQGDTTLAGLSCDDDRCVTACEDADRRERRVSRRGNQM